MHDHVHASTIQNLDLTRYPPTETTQLAVLPFRCLNMRSKSPKLDKSAKVIGGYDHTKFINLTCTVSGNKRREKRSTLKYLPWIAL